MATMSRVNISLWLLVAIATIGCSTAYRRGRSSYRSSRGSSYRSSRPTYSVSKPNYVNRWRGMGDYGDNRYRGSQQLISSQQNFIKGWSGSRGDYGDSKYRGAQQYGGAQTYGGNLGGYVYRGSQQLGRPTAFYGTTHHGNPEWDRGYYTPDGVFRSGGGSRGSYRGNSGRYGGVQSLGRYNNKGLTGSYGARDTSRWNMEVGPPPTFDSQGRHTGYVGGPNFVGRSGYNGGRVSSGYPGSQNSFGGAGSSYQSSRGGIGGSGRGGEEREEREVDD